MNSLIGKYSVETRDDNGDKTGHFYLDLPNAYAVSKEAVGTHLHMKGSSLESFVNSRLPSIWSNIDVNKDGKIDAMKGTNMLRMLIGNVEANEGLQV